MSQSIRISNISDSFWFNLDDVISKYKLSRFGITKLLDKKGVKEKDGLKAVSDLLEQARQEILNNGSK